MLKSTYDPDDDGIIGVAQGGTGQTTLAEARNAMGLGNSTSQLAVANGGTGKTTHTSNSVIVGNGNSALKNIASAKGAFHSTGSGNEPQFGTLPIDEGGTGLTANPSMLVNLASGSADNVLKASPRPGVTGVLPVANGGTGSASISGLLDSLDIPPKSDIAPTYTSTKAYKEGAYVYYTVGGVKKLYKCIQDTSAGTAPTNTAYWKKDSLGQGLTDLNNDLSNIGNITTNSNTVSVGNNSTTNITNISLSPGKYIIVAVPTFSTLVAADIVCSIIVGSASQGGFEMNTSTVGFLTHNAVRIVNITSTSTVYLRVLQKTGQTVSVSGVITAIRIA